MNEAFWRGKRVVVGGGCGFLGSYLVPTISAAGARVTVVDNFENGERPTPGAPIDWHVLEGDLRDSSFCDSILDGCELFINLAAKAAGIEFSRTHHGEMLVDNLLCGLVPLKSAHRLRTPHVVIASSSCVYPDDAPVPTPELDPVTREPESANAGYGWAKRVQELAGRYLASETGARVTILRPLNLYGAKYPWRSSEKGHVIPSLVKRILDGEDPLVVWGSGNQRRNFLHGNDAAEVISRVIAGGAEGPVNIGYEDSTSIADLVTLICDVTGRRPRIVFDTTRPDGAALKSADSTRLRGLTGDYTPKVTLRDGIEEMVEWYRKSFAPAPQR